MLGPDILSPYSWQSAGFCINTFHVFVGKHLQSKPEDEPAKDSKPAAPAAVLPRSEGLSMNAAAAPFQSRGSTGGDSASAFPRCNTACCGC